MTLVEKGREFSGRIGPVSLSRDSAVLTEVPSRR